MTLTLIFLFIIYYNNKLFLRKTIHQDKNDLCDSPVETSFYVGKWLFNSCELTYQQPILNPYSKKCDHFVNTVNTNLGWFFMLTSLFFDALFFVPYSHLILQFFVYIQISISTPETKLPDRKHVQLRTIKKHRASWTHGGSGSISYDDFSDSSSHLLNTF